MTKLQDGGAALKALAQHVGQPLHRVRGIDVGTVLLRPLSSSPALTKRKLLIAGAAMVMLGGTVAGSVLALGSAVTQPAANSALPPATAQVARTALVETRTVAGTLGYGDPVPVRATGTGTLTWIAPEGSTVQRGELLFKVGVGSSYDRANLSFGTSGRLAEINVAVGDQVQAGQVLARLATEPLEIKLEQAQSQLESAKLRRQQLAEGASAEEIAAAQAAYDAAQAKYEQLRAGPTAADLAAAEAAVASAQASYDQAVAKLQTLEQGTAAADRAATESALESARNNLAAAEARLEQLRAGPTPEELAQAQSAVDQARANLRSAESKLDQVRAAGTVPADVAAAQSALASAESQLVAARNALNAKEDSLAQAKAELEAQQAALEVSKRKAEETCMEEGDSSTACKEALAATDKIYPAVRAAEAKMRQLAGDDAPEMKAAREALKAEQAAYDAAKARYEQVKAAAAIPTDLTSAQAGVDNARAALASAEAKLRQLQQGPTKADLVAAETAVETARANLASAEAKLAALDVSGPQDLETARSAVRSAEAGLQSAQAKLEQLRAGAGVADLEAARSSVASAQASLAQKSGAKETDLAIQMEAVRQAELSVRQAELDLANATLVAPFDGVVAAINANVGEQAPTGANAFLVLIEGGADESERHTVADVAVDESGLPVVALYGSVPLYRTLSVGAQGADVRQLQQNLAELGYTGFTVDGAYTSATAEAARAWQADLGLPQTGIVEPGQVVFTPGPVRVAEHIARVGDALGGGGGSGGGGSSGSASGDSSGGSSGGGASVLSYTGTDRLVTVPLRVDDLALAVVGSTVTVTVPGVGAVEGEISQLDTVVTGQQDTGQQDASIEDASIEVTVTIANHQALGALDAAPVDVDFVSQERKDVLVAPVAALLALAEGGYGVEVVDGNTTRIVPVRTGMFADGRVEVSGEGIAEGMTVGVAR